MKSIYLLLVICYLLLTSATAQNWSKVGYANIKASITAIKFDTYNNLYVAGEFDDSLKPVNNTHACVIEYNSYTWNKLGTGSNALKAYGWTNTLCSDKFNNIYAAGILKDTANNYEIVAKWNGAAWSQLGSGINSLNANEEIVTLISDTSGNIYAAGDFTDGANSYLGKCYVAKWNGNTWSELGTGANALNAPALNIIHILGVDKLGNIYAAGSFKNSSGKCYVAKWNGNTWSELGTGVNALSANNTIFRLIIDNYNNIYATGLFTNSYGNYYVAKWNGTTWAELGTGSNALNANNPISSLAADKMGNIYAAGNFTDSVIYSPAGKRYVAKWDGHKWCKLGKGINALNANGNIQSIEVDYLNNIYVAGDFTDSTVWNGNYYVAKWSHCWLHDTIHIKTCTASGYYFHGEFRTQSGYYNDTCSSYYGCDSITTLHLTISIVSSAIDTICSATPYYFHGVMLYHALAGNYIDTVASAACDTLFVVALTVRRSSELDTTAYICSYRAAWFNNTAYSLPGYYFIHLTNHDGCDSLIKLTLNVYPSTFASYYLSGDSVICTVPNIKYQWIDCATKQQIAGETHRYFIPTQTGAYAVIAMDSICIDTTSCYYIVFSGIGNDLSLSQNQLLVYPNPATNQLTIVNQQSLTKTIEVYDVVGRKFDNLKMSRLENAIQIQVSDFSSGIYFIKATDEKGFVHTAKFVKE